MNKLRRPFYFLFIRLGWGSFFEKGRYDNKYEGPYFETPTYSEVDVPEDALEYINKRYAALLTMTDNHFGKFIQRLKDLDMYEDTMIIVTTDHGYFLGERNYLGKRTSNGICANSLYICI